MTNFTVNSWGNINIYLTIYLEYMSYVLLFDEFKISKPISGSYQTN